MCLTRQLTKAKDRFQLATTAVSLEHQGGEWEEWEAAWNDVLRLERLVAAANGEEYAEPLDFPVQWDVGTPLPHLFDNGIRTFLTFYVRDPDPEWDSTHPVMRSLADQAEVPLALVEFERCTSVRMGAPNDEVQQGHPLHGKGLRGYTAQVVRNSKWLAELEAMSRVHEYYNPEFWKGQRHFIFWFRDEAFECVARGFKVEVFRESMGALMHRVVHRLLEE